MSRNLDTTLASTLSAGLIRPAFFASITFKSATRYVWTGVGNFVYAGNTYEGVGSFGQIGAISEGTDVNAAGTTIMLSGIDPVLQAECLTDIQLGAPVKIWFGLLTPAMTMVGVPYLLFSGTVDQPTVSVSPTTMSISLALENPLINLQRASNRRYTAADQHIQYPTDCAFNWVELLNDVALIWGT